MRFKLWAVMAAAMFAGFGCATYSDDNPRRTPGTAIDDNFIKRIAKHRIRKADEGLRAGHVTVVCFNGIVLITGQVESEELRSTATEAISSVKKIRLVRNEMQVEGTATFISRTNDNYLWSKVKTKLSTTENVNGRRVKIVVENGVVYLLGVVSPDEGERAAVAASTVGGVRKVVKVFEYSR